MSSKLTTPGGFAKHEFFGSHLKGAETPIAVGLILRTLEQRPL